METENKYALMLGGVQELSGVKMAQLCVPSLLLFALSDDTDVARKILKKPLFELLQLGLVVRLG